MNSQPSIQSTLSRTINSTVSASIARKRKQHLQTFHLVLMYVNSVLLLTMLDSLSLLITSNHYLMSSGILIRLRSRNSVVTRSSLISSNNTNQRTSKSLLSMVVMQLNIIGLSYTLKQKERFTKRLSHLRTLRRRLIELKHKLRKDSIDLAWP